VAQAIWNTRVQAVFESKNLNRTIGSLPTLPAPAGRRAHCPGGCLSGSPCLAPRLRASSAFSARLWSARTRNSPDTRRTSTAEHRTDHARQAIPGSPSASDVRVAGSALPESAVPGNSLYQSTVFTWTVHVTASATDRPCPCRLDDQSQHKEKEKHFWTTKRMVRSRNLVSNLNQRPRTRGAPN